MPRLKPQAGGQPELSVSAHFDNGWQNNDLGFRNKSLAHVGATLSF